MTAERPNANGLIYKFDPDTEIFVEYEAPGESPFDITADSRGTIWFTDFRGGTINSLNPRTGLILVEYQAPDGVNQHCRGIAVDLNDVVWSTCGTTLVKYHRNPLRILEDVFAIPKALKPFGVFADDTGVIWILDQHHTTLYRFNADSEDFDDWLVPPFPDETTVDPHWLVKRGDTIYYTGFTGVVGTFNVRRDTFGAYISSPSRGTEAGSGAYDIAIDRVGRVWFTEALANKLSHVVFPRLPNPRPIPIPRD